MMQNWNYKHRYITALVLTLSSFAQAQETYETIYKNLAIPNNLTEINLNEVDKVLALLENSYNVGYPYLSINAHIDRRTITYRAFKTHRVYYCYDTLGTLLKKRYRYRRGGRKYIPRFMEFQLLKISNSLYRTCQYNDVEFEGQPINNVVLANTFLNSCYNHAIEDSMTGYLFLFEDLRDSERDMKIKKGEYTPTRLLTPTDYHAIFILDESIIPRALLIRANNLRDAHLVILNRNGAYDSGIIMTWDEMKFHSVEYWVSKIKELANVVESNKICDKSIFGFQYTSWTIEIKKAYSKR